MAEFINLPGFAGSGPDHWQTRWELEDERFRRFSPSSWDQPKFDDWISALDHEVEISKEPPILVAHSLACLLVAHWSVGSRRKIAGAFLVAPPDPASPAYAEPDRGFGNVPKLPLGFPSVVVASSNDPFAEIGHARLRAAQWGSTLIEVGDLGHIGSASGLGDWKHGRDLLRAFSSGVSLG